MKRNFFMGASVLGLFIAVIWTLIVFLRGGL